MARNNPRSKKKSSRSKSSANGGIIKFITFFLKWSILLSVLAVVLASSVVAGIFYYYGRDLPELLSRDDFDPPQVTRIYASQGELIAELFIPGGRRTIVPLEKIPPNVLHAFMAAEDSDFMIHSGIDYLGLVRAFYYAARHDTGMRGTSTITQQVVKNLILTPERALERKIKEILLALQLEKNLTKDDILFLYLNTIYLGHGTNGVEEASRFYFGKSVTDLTIAEAALIAGLTQSPERLTPVRHHDRALNRRSYVLRQLWEKGFINEAEYRSAEDTPITLASRSITFPHIGKAPYFVEYIRKNLVETFGEQATLGGGLRVYTTLNLSHQEAAERAARKGLREYDQRRGFYRPVRKLSESKIEPFLQEQNSKLSEGLQPDVLYEAVVMDIDKESESLDLRIGATAVALSLNPRTRILGEGAEQKDIDELFERGHILRVFLAEARDGDKPIVQFEPGPEVALVAIDPHSREITAWVGGYDFDLNRFDHVVQARRQTGSAFKTMVFAAALEQKIITPATIYLDSPTVFQMPDGETWSPRNADGDWRGQVRVREGLGASRNVVAVRVLQDLGLKKAQEFAKRVGIESQLADNFTLVMGSSEMPPIELTNAYATFASGGHYAVPRALREIESVRGEKTVFETHPEPVLAPEVAYLTTNLLESAVHGYIDQNGKRRVGTGHVTSQLGHPIAGKTGTTNDSRDAWFVGYTPSLVSGVWVGFSNNRSLGNREYGGRVAAPVFRDFMQEILEGEEPQTFEAPDMGVTKAKIDGTTGKLARRGGIEEVFLIGTAPTEYAPLEEEGSTESFFLDQFQ